MKRAGLAVPLLACAVGFAAAGPASAFEATGCRTTDLTGVWVGTAPKAFNDEYCAVQFRDDGKIIQSSCFGRSTMAPTATLEGSFRVKGDCTATGRYKRLLKAGTEEEIVFRGKLDPKTNLLTGRITIGTQDAKPYRFSELWN
jgi:hypothetical protein